MLTTTPHQHFWQRRRYSSLTNIFSEPGPSSGVFSSTSAGVLIVLLAGCQSHIDAMRTSSGRLLHPRNIHLYFHLGPVRVCSLTPVTQWKKSAFDWTSSRFVHYFVLSFTEKIKICRPKHPNAARILNGFQTVPEL